MKINWPCVRPKRKDGAAADCTERIFVPMPWAVKAEVYRLCRENNLSQADLGLRLLRTILAEAELVARAVASDDAAPPAAGAQRSEHRRAGGEQEAAHDEHV